MLTGSWNGTSVQCSRDSDLLLPILRTFSFRAELELREGILIFRAGAQHIGR